MSRRVLVIILVIIGVVAAVYATVGSSMLGSGGQVRTTSVGKVEIGGPFDLVGADGQQVSDRDFRGRYMLVYFGYTFCPDVCPTSLGEITIALDMLSPEQLAKVAPILITVDPERDTPENVGEYVKSFHPHIIGLGGSMDNIRAAAKAYRAYFSRGEADEDGNYPVDHSSYTYLMGPDGEFVKAFRHGTTGSDMAEYIKSVL